MTTGDPKPQTEQIRELFVTGDLEQLNALLDLEAGLPTNHTFGPVKRTALTLFGPIVRGTSICWLIHDGCHPVLSSYRSTRERTLIHFDLFHFSVSPDSTLQQVYDTIALSDVDPCDALRVGLLRAIPLPHDCLRLLFAVAGFEDPSRFWLLVDDLTAELHRLGFCAAAPLPVPSPLAGEAAGEAQPWLQVPDYLWDRQALELWWNGLTMPEIAARLGYTEKTIRNRFSTLRAIYGTDTVPTADRLRKLRVR